MLANLTKGLYLFIKIFKQSNIFSQNEINLKSISQNTLITGQKLFSYWVILCLAILLVAMAGCKRGSVVREGDNNSPISRADPQSVPGILYRATVQVDSFGYTNKGDSLFDLAINVAVESGRSDQIALAYIYSLKHSSSKPENEAQALEFYNTAKYNAGLSGSTSLTDELDLAMADYYTKIHDTGQSDRYLNRLSVYDGNNLELFLKKELIEAKNFGVRERPFEQLKSLLDVMYRSLGHNYDSIYQVSLLNISDFYYFEQQYDKALDYIDQLKNHIEATGNSLDSNRVYFLLANKLPIYNQLFDPNATIKLAEFISLYAEKHGYELLDEIAQGQARTALINTGDFQQVEDYYDRHPGLLNQLKTSDPSIYYRMLSYMQMNKVNKDSVLIYYAKAGELMDGKNDFYKALYYYRRGELLEKLGLGSLCVPSYKKALDLLGKGHDLVLQNTLIEKIAGYFKAQRNTPGLISLLEKKDTVNMKLMKINKEQNIRQLELSNILSVYELKHQKATEENNRKQNVQLQIIALAILLVFMALLVMANFKLPAWWIRSMGYLSIIILFEFIILLVDRRLHNALHDDVIKLILVKVALISVIFPLHHKAEKKIISFLLERDRFKGLRNFFSSFLRKHKKEAIQGVDPAKANTPDN